MTIQEKNEKIALFMGWKQVNWPNSFNEGYSKTWVLNEFNEDFTHVDDYSKDSKFDWKNAHPQYENLYFHQSWNQLMPVVEKIESLGAIVEIWMSLGKSCRIHNVKTHKNYTFESNSTIEAVYEAVYQFIE